MMTTKTTNIVYWVATIVFALLILMDGFGGVTRQQAGQDVLNHLGYPLYLLTIVGIAKLLAVVALLQTKYIAIKEWAFAGIAFNFIGGFASRAFVGDGAFETIFPLIMLGIMFIPYFLWKKRVEAK
ncbi:MAG: DoxX family protein [Bacteroidota bacterium]